MKRTAFSFWQVFTCIGSGFFFKHWHFFFLFSFDKSSFFCPFNTTQGATRFFLISGSQGATEVQIADVLRQGLPHLTDPPLFKTKTSTNSLRRLAYTSSRQERLWAEEEDAHHETRCVDEPIVSHRCRLCCNCGCDEDVDEEEEIDEESLAGEVEVGAGGGGRWWRRGGTWGRVISTAGRSFELRTVVRLLGRWCTLISTVIQISRRRKIRVVENDARRWR